MKFQNEEINHLNNELKELNSTKDKFFSIIAHDLKNPLGTFTNVTKMLYEMPEDFSKDERQEFMKLMKDSADNVYALLENLLEWSRSQRGSISFNPVEVNLYDIVRITNSILHSSAHSKIINLENKIPVNYNIFVDPNLITTVIRNLVSNSIKFTHENGTIEIGVGDDTSDDSILIYVKDTGIGMSDKIKNKLFKIEENVTSLGTFGEKGTGLGLILCKEFVEKHGGKIWVESELEKGSTFWIKIPR